MLKNSELEIPDSKSYTRFFTLENLIKGFFILTIFFFPFQIQTIIYDSYSYTSGNFTPYNSFILYLSDVFLLLTGILYFSYCFLYKKKISFGHPILIKGILLFLFFINMGIFFAIVPEIIFIHTFRFLKGVLFYILLVNNIVKKECIIHILITVSCMQVVLGLYQYFFQHSLGIFFLGEPHIAPELPGVAKIDSETGKYIRSYGTFSHPNIFGGFLAMVLLFTSYLPKKTIFTILKIALFIGILITFSRSVIIGLLITIFIYTLFFKHVKLSTKKYVVRIFICLFLVVLTYGLLSTVFSEVFLTESVSLRIMYMKIALKILFVQPWGIGAGHYILHLPKFTEESLFPWNIQPVHNVFLLVGSEWGIIPFLLLVFLCIYLFCVLWEKRQFKEIKVVFMLLTLVLILMNFDHYFMTIYAGSMLFWIVLFFFNDALTMPSIKTLLQKKLSNENHKP